MTRFIGKDEKTPDMFWIWASCDNVLQAFIDTLIRNYLCHGHYSLAGAKSVHDFRRYCGKDKEYVKNEIFEARLGFANPTRSQPKAGNEISEIPGFLSRSPKMINFSEYLPLKYC